MGKDKTTESTRVLIEFLRNAVNRQHAPIGQFWGVIISIELAAEVADRLEAYDKTGMTPEEIVAMRDEHERLLTAMLT
jgi:hypothetical protein